jgi:phosphoenolpyruvate carboxylase
MNDTQKYYNNVTLKYQLFNSLFLLLPFEGINTTGTFLPLFTKICEQGLNKGLTSEEIINNFFDEYVSVETSKGRLDYLFDFIKYIERQVVLFDSIEDASFEQLKSNQGKGSIKELSIRVNAEKKIEEFKKLLEEVSVRIVLTAHPTQFYTGDVLGIIADLEPAIKSNDISQVDVLLRQLGKTPFLKKIKPTPYEEAISLIWFLENVFYKAIPKLFKSVLNTVGLSSDQIKNTSLFSIGFWPGGDRDGNPFVTHETTLQVANRLRSTLLKCYYRDLRIIRRRLTFAGVVELVSAAEQRIYNGAYGDETSNYASADEFIFDLNKILELLLQSHQGLFKELVEDLILKIRIFGFHFAKMDVRQNMKIHRLAWKQLLDTPEIVEVDYINQLLSLKKINTSISNSESSELISSINSVISIQKRNGEEACCRYIISNSTAARDVIEVYSLFKLINNGEVPMDIIPLFESVEDLNNASYVMQQLFEIEEYRNHLSKRSNKQTIMLGFSDGTKDGGYLKANWSIFKAKESLTEICKQYDVQVVFFDGRGGPPGRGGGNTHEFYASQGNTISSKEIQITIQGQTINSNFGKVASCQYNLEQLFSALIENQLFLDNYTNLTTADRILMEDLCNESYKSYLNLKNHKSFVPYLENATPLKWFGETNIGSRPAKRNASGGFVFEDLRAIPFVGSWAQMKQNVPGYYGIGSGLNSIINQGKKQEIINLVNKSLYLKSLLSNSNQSLAKCNFEVSEWLSKSTEFSEFYKMLKDEYELSELLILEVMQIHELMEDVPVSKESVKVRESIVMPLVVIQQFALQMINSSKIDDDEIIIYQKLVLRCMFGIINAARNAA